MGVKTAVSARNKLCFFITSVTKYRIPFFLVSMFRDTLIKGIEISRRRYRFKLLSYVLMPDHIHLMIIPGSEKNISYIMKDIKAYSGREISRILGERGKVWEEGFIKQPVGTKTEFDEILESIHNNPVRRGIVKDPFDYTYSSYRFLSVGEEGPMKVDVWEGFRD